MQSRITSTKSKKAEMTTDSIISKVWGFCTTLRDDGVSYGDPKDLAEDIVENIEAGLNNFRTVLAALGK